MAGTPGKGSTNVDVIQLDGSSETVNSVSITTLMRDPSGNILMAQGTTTPTAGSSGYAVGAEFVLTTGATSTVYTTRSVNVGSTTSCLFKALALAYSTP